MQLKIQTQRDRVVQEWQAAGKPYLTNFKAYKSTCQVEFKVLHPLNNVAHAVAKAGQVLEFFSYGIGDTIPFGPSPLSRRATEADTNLTSSHNTNGQEDFVIEGASLSASSTRVAYEGGDLARSFTDADVMGAYRGLVPLHDPASHIAPPQVCSPFNLEQVLLTAIAPYMTFEFEFDRRRKEAIGTLDQVPEGGAKSYLRANGDPRTDNRIRFPEGYLWRGEGKPDSEMVVRSTLRSPIVIPLTMIEVEALGDDGPVPPTHLFLDLAMRVHGLSCGPVSRN